MLIVPGGRSVSPSVLTNLGSLSGQKVGEAVEGVPVGPEEGCVVGKPVGGVVGPSVGPDEGCVVGKPVGGVVGPSVGARVGDILMVGDPVGSLLG